MSSPLSETFRFFHLSAIQLAGRRYALLPFAVLSWPAAQGLLLWIGWRRNAFQPVEAQTLLLGAPLALLAAFLGPRIIASWVEERTIEVAYTVPETWRLWSGGLIVAVALLVGAEILLAVAVAVLFTGFAPTALWGALSGALWYLVLGMYFGSLSRSVVTGSALVLAALAGNAVFSPFLGRFSPFWNPAAHPEVSPFELLAATVQNRVGTVLFAFLLAALAFRRAQARERLLRS